MTVRPVYWALLITCLIAVASSAAPLKYWVIFRDKGQSREIALVLDGLRANWPERSLLRRTKTEAAISESDLPVNASYIAELADAGFKAMAQSRWLNAVSIMAEPSDITKLSLLPFVESVRTVAIIGGDEVEASETIDFGAGYYPAVELGDYGPSFRQAEMAGVVEAHKRGLTGRGVLIGMLDSGFQLDHRALAGMDLIGQYDFIFNDADPSYDPRTDPRGQASHGTACLSVIAGFDPGKLLGIAPKASFALGKTESTASETRAEEDWWIEGIEWLEMMGADVVSSSLTYRDWYSAAELDGESPLVSRAAQRACELGMIICISAGNSGPNPITIGAPADAPDVLAIAAADSTGAITRFSSRGPSADGRIKPDVAAMGRKVVCVSPLTYDEYARWNGTSLACPIVAGVAALVIEAHPDWSPEKVREALRETASQAFMPDDSAGYGLVDCDEALKYPCISGSVLLADDHEMHDEITVEAERIDKGGLKSSETRIFKVAPSGLGYFEFPTLADGRYSIRARAVSSSSNGEKISLHGESVVEVPPSASIQIKLQLQK